MTIRFAKPSKGLSPGFYTVRGGTDVMQVLRVLDGRVTYRWSSADIERERSIGEVMDLSLCPLRANDLVPWHFSPEYEALMPKVQAS